MLKRTRFYGDLVAFVAAGALFGYLFAKGEWIDGIPALAATVGGLLYAGRHYGPKSEAISRREQAERDYERQHRW